MTSPCGSSLHLGPVVALRGRRTMPWIQFAGQLRGALSFSVEAALSDRSREYLGSALYRGPRPAFAGTTVLLRALPSGSLTAGTRRLRLGRSWRMSLHGAELNLIDPFWSVNPQGTALALRESCYVAGFLFAVCPQKYLPILEPLLRCWEFGDGVRAQVREDVPLGLPP